MTNQTFSRSVPLDDAALADVAGGGKGAALLFRDIGRLIGNIFRSGEKVASKVGGQIERTNTKIDAVHDLVKDRADRQA